MGYLVGGGPGGVPSVGELERHYRQLEEQKKQMEDMVERTQQLMTGLKKGIDDLRANDRATASRAASPRPGTGHGAPTNGSPRIPGMGMGIVGISSTSPRVPSPLGSPKNQMKTQEQQQQSPRMDVVDQQAEEGTDEDAPGEPVDQGSPQSMPMQLPLDRTERRISAAGSVWPVTPAVASE